MPDALELPWLGSAVVPLVGTGVALVCELIACLLPRPAAVFGGLDRLADPPDRLRGVESVGVGRRALDVEHLPAREVRPADAPVLALAVRGHDERALAGTYQESYAAHTQVVPID